MSVIRFRMNYRLKSNGAVSLTLFALRSSGWSVCGVLYLEAAEFEVFRDLCVGQGIEVRSE